MGVVAEKLALTPEFLPYKMVIALVSVHTRFMNKLGLVDYPFILIPHVMQLIPHLLLYTVSSFRSAMAPRDVKGTIVSRRDLHFAVSAALIRLFGQRPFAAAVIISIILVRMDGKSGADKNNNTTASSWLTR